MKISVYLNTQRKRMDGNIPVSLCVSRPPHRFYVSTGLTTKSEFKGEVFPRTEANHRAKTIRLIQYIDDIERILLETPSISEVKQRIKTEVFEKKEVTTKYLWKYIEDFANTKTEHSTKEKYIGTANKVRQFDKFATLDISPAWLNRFESELLRDVKVNTVSLHLRNIRAVINWSITNGITQNYPFRAFRIHSEPTRKRNLTIDEIIQIKNSVNINEEYRDIFMLSFYFIGVNMKDLLNATHEQIYNGRFEYKRAKTKKMYSVRIEPEAQILLDKYKGETHLLSIADKRCVHNNNRLINESLRKIKDGTTTYYARHSWASIAYSLGISKDIISQALGHSTGSSVTEIYINKDAALVDEANRKVLDAIRERELIL